MPKAKKEGIKQEEIKEEKKIDTAKETLVAAGADENLKELTDTLQHLQAEFENYKKRVEKESSEFIKIANEDLIRLLLPIIDNFELALKSCRAKDDFYKGMELIYSQLIETLHSQGLKPINCTGKKFDPYYHEVLLVEESDKEDNTVLEELQKGYLLYDKVIRHSKVKIAKRKKEEKKEEGKKEEKSPAGIDYTVVNSKT